MSLHCPATVLLAAPGDREHLSELVRSLRGGRIAGVFTGPRAGAEARLAGELLGVSVVQREDLGTGLGERDAGVAALREALLAVADEFRGETVLMLLGDQARSFALAVLVGAPGGGELPSTDPVAVEVGDDGFRVLPWPVRSAPR